MLAFEVLDNLPHDCVVRQVGSADWQEVTVEREPSGSLHLSERPLHDPLIRQVLGSAQWDKAGSVSPQWQTNMYRTANLQSNCIDPTAISQTL